MMGEGIRGSRGWGLFAKRRDASLRRRRGRGGFGGPSEALETRLLLTTPDASGLTFFDSVERDFNGDDLDDVIEMNEDGQWWVGTKDASTVEPDFQTSIWADWSDASNFRHVDFGDFNRDQNADILGIDLWGNVWVGISNGSDAFTTTLWGTGFTGELAHVAVSDVNADLYFDLIAFTADGSWEVALSNRTNGFGATAQWADWADASNFAHIAVADFDGDAVNDDVAGMDTVGVWWVAIGNGHFVDYFPQPGSGNAFGGTSQWGDWADASAFAKIETADFNGDGAADVAGFDHSGNWWVANSNSERPSLPGNPPVATAFVGTTLSADWSDAANFLTVGVGDFNGDGSADFAGLDLSGNWWVRAPFSSQTQPAVVVITQLWASWGDVSNLREVDLANFDGTATDVAGFDAEGRWRVGTSAFGTLIDHPPSRFLHNTFWAEWDPADTFATLNGDLSIKRQLNELPLV